MKHIILLLALYVVASGWGDVKYQITHHSCKICGVDLYQKSEVKEYSGPFMPSIVPGYFIQEPKDMGRLKCFEIHIAYTPVCQKCYDSLKPAKKEMLEYWDGRLAILLAAHAPERAKYDKARQDKIIKQKEATIKQLETELKRLK